MTVASLNGYTPKIDAIRDVRSAFDASVLDAARDSFEPLQGSVRRLLTDQADRVLFLSLEDHGTLGLARRHQLQDLSLPVRPDEVSAAAQLNSIAAKRQLFVAGGDHILAQFLHGNCQN